MENKSTILVAVDFTPSSDEAFDVALRLAKRHQSSLTLVHIVLSPAVVPPSMAMMIEIDRTELAKKALDALIERAVAEGVSATSIVDCADVAVGLLQTIEQVSPEMVIVGSHGHGGISRALLGSVSQTLTRRSPVPVLVVPFSKRRAVTEKMAWACESCGHIAGRGESTAECSQCGVVGGAWEVAPMLNAPADIDERPMSDGERETLPNDRVQGSLGFGTSPPGTSGYDVNAELKIRY